MCCDSSQRKCDRGFSLLEVMIAMACVGLLLTTIYNMSVSLTRKQAEAWMSYENTAMARALLDEFVTTYPQMPTSGNYKSKWDWRITEEMQPASETTEFDNNIELIRVTVEVRRVGAVQDPFYSSVVVSRRNGGL
ncbi:type IV pilus modification PilV family protein [Ruegeria sp.]|uniref:type IV pilus modification PilV family protein n=1 Tax=Ruegeria sp. TaxID=1879320 RepID=UPI003C7A883F